MDSILWQTLPVKYLHWLFGGFGMTVALSLAVSVLGCMLAAAWLALRRARWRPVAIMANAAIGLLRKTPLLVQLFFWYFGAAQLLGDAAIAAISAWRGIQLGAVAVPAPSLEARASTFGIRLYATASYARDWEAGI